MISACLHVSTAAVSFAHAHTSVLTVAVWDDLNERKKAAASARQFELARVRWCVVFVSVGVRQTLIALTYTVDKTDTNERARLNQSFHPAETFTHIRPLLFFATPTPTPILA